MAAIAKSAKSNGSLYLCQSSTLRHSRRRLIRSDRTRCKPALLSREKTPQSIRQTTQAGILPWVIFPRQSLLKLAPALEHIINGPPVAHAKMARLQLPLTICSSRTPIVDTPQTRVHGHGPEACIKRTCGCRSISTRSSTRHPALAMGIPHNRQACPNATHLHLPKCPTCSIEALQALPARVVTDLRVQALVGCQMASQATRIRRAMSLAMERKSGSQREGEIKRLLSKCLRNENLSQPRRNRRRRQNESQYLVEVGEGGSKRGGWIDVLYCYWDGRGCPRLMWINDT